MLSSGLSRGSWRWCGVAGLLACTLVACVNRGMHAPELDAASDRGPAPDAARDRTVSDSARDVPTADGALTDAATEMTGGAGGTALDASVDARGLGGSGAGVGGHGAGGTTGAGAGGTAGGGAGGAGAATMDAGSPDVPRTCQARFNFEGGNRHGAFINSGFQTAFSNLASASDAACGGGSLRLDTTVTPTADKGEVIIPLGATEDVSGRTFSIFVKAVPAATPNPYVIVFLVPSYAFVTAFSPIPSVWTSSTVTLPAGADAGTRATTGISIQLLGRGDAYAGAFYLDEIDLR